MSTPTALDKARSLLEERRSELRSELDQIEAALAGLGGGSGSRRGPGRPRGSKAQSRRSSSSGKRRRRRSGGTRADHALKKVNDQPGATAAEVASALGIKPNYVYRVMAELEKDGLVEKRGKGYFPAAAAAGPDAAHERTEDPEDKAINPTPAPVATKVDA